MYWFYHEHNLLNKIRTNYHNLNKEISEFKRGEYDRFKQELLNIKGKTENACAKKVRVLNRYYKEVDSFVSGHNITSQSKFRPTVLEEFVGYLFKDIPELDKLGLGFFNKNVFAGLKIDSTGHIIIQTKDVDFCIGKKFAIKINGEKNELIIPIAAIECKTYLDNTMFNEAQFSAQKLKSGTPGVKVYILAERNEVGLDKLPTRSPVDEIFIIRQDGEKIDESVVYDFFKEVHKAIKGAIIKEEIKLPGRLLNYKM
ncbi:hypothetical protein DRQ36_11070 [bacterium]|nr:MAG: hypothetical protein DRQ36_11070 [bacterium]